MDSQRDEYHRTVYSILDMTGQVGGVFEILTLFFGFIVSGYNKRMLLYSLAENIYYTQTNLSPKSDVNIENDSVTCKKSNKIVPKQKEDYKNQTLSTSLNKSVVESHIGVSEDRDYTSNTINNPRSKDLTSLSDRIKTWRNYKIT